MTPLHAPPSLPAAAPVEVAATVKYVVCREICIPGKADLSLSIPAEKQTDADASPSRKLFQATRAQLPNPLPADLRINATSMGKYFVLQIEGSPATNDTRFFPLDPGVIENSAPQSLTSNGKVARLTLKWFDQPVKPLSRLRGVIVLDKNHAYKIDVPVGVAVRFD